MKKIYSLLLLVLTQCTVTPLAYSGEGHHHHATGIELGLSPGWVHLDEENENAPVLHLHVSKPLGDEGLKRQLSLGIGGEIIFADEDHYALFFPLSYNPWQGLVLSVAPGIEWADHEGEWETAYTTHLEAAYVWEVGDYDIGPVFGFSKTTEEEHYMAGLHLGIHL